MLYEVVLGRLYRLAVRELRRDDREESAPLERRRYVTGDRGRDTEGDMGLEGGFEAGAEAGAGGGGGTSSALCELLASTEELSRSAGTRGGGGGGEDSGSGEGLEIGRAHV